MTECLGIDLQSWEGKGAPPQREGCKGKYTFPDKKSLRLRTSCSFDVCGTDSRMCLSSGFWAVGCAVQDRDGTWRFLSGVHHYNISRIKEADKIMQ